MRIHFARHGESQANLLHEISNRGLKHGLTAKGYAQAVALAQRLQRHSIAHIYSSPLLRAVQTSMILANQLAVSYQVTDALREYDCGILEGRSDDAAWQGWQELSHAWVVHRRWEERIEGGESFSDIRARFEPFIQGLVEQYRGTDTEVVCVSHGGIYWMMLPLVLRNVDAELISRCGCDYAACVVAELRPAGLYCVQCNGHAVQETSGAP